MSTPSKRPDDPGMRFVFFAAMVGVLFGPVVFGLAFPDLPVVLASLLAAGVSAACTLAYLRKPSLSGVHRHKRAILAATSEGLPRGLEWSTRTPRGAGPEWPALGLTEKGRNSPFVEALVVTDRGLPHPRVSWDLTWETCKIAGPDRAENAALASDMLRDFAVATGGMMHDPVWVGPHQDCRFEVERHTVRVEYLPPRGPRLETRHTVRYGPDRRTPLVLARAVPVPDAGDSASLEADLVGAVWPAWASAYWAIVQEGRHHRVERMQAAREAAQRVRVSAAVESVSRSARPTLEEELSALEAVAPSLGTPFRRAWESVRHPREGRN